MVLSKRTILVLLLLTCLSAACTGDETVGAEITNTLQATKTISQSPTPTATSTHTQTPAPTSTSVAKSVLSNASLAYTSFSQSGFDLFIRHPSGDNLKLTDGSKIFFDPHWSHDGQKLAFLSYDPIEEALGIMVCAAPLLPENCHEVINGLTNTQYMSWSSDNDHIYFSDVQADGVEKDVYSLHADSGQLINLTRFSTVWDDAPSASPTEDRIAFVSDRADLGKGTDEVWIMRGDGTGLERLTFNHEYFWEDTDPVFSPDGKFIAFYRSSFAGGDYPGGIPGIWIIDLSSREEWLLYEHDGMMFSDPPRWSPDGTSIVFNTGGLDEMDLYIVSVEDGSVLQLTDFAGEETFASWSGDSRWILFTHSKEDAFSLYLVSADGSVLEQVDLPGNAGFGSISP